MELDNFKNSLKRLKKCDMYWNEMEPNEIGRLCQKCDKSIIDFSKMSFSEIAFKMSETNLSTCGYYLPEQLLEIKRSKKNIPLTIGLTTLIASTSVANSANKEIEKHYSNKVSDYNEKSAEITRKFEITNDSISINGKVEYYDSISKTNLTDAYVYVIIKGTKTGTTTNENGDFKIKYLPSVENEKITLLFGGIEFKKKEIEISTNDKVIDLGVLILEKEQMILTSFYVTKKRSFVGKIIRKITRQFK